MEDRRSFGISGSLRGSQHCLRQCEQFRADFQPRLSRRVQIHLKPNLAVFCAEPDRAAVLRELIRLAYRENRQSTRAGQRLLNMLFVRRTSDKQNLALADFSRSIQVLYPERPFTDRFSV